MEHTRGQPGYTDGEEHADNLGDAIKGSHNGRYYLYRSWRRRPVSAELSRTGPVMVR